MVRYGITNGGIDAVVVAFSKQIKCCKSQNLVELKVLLFGVASVEPGFWLLSLKRDLRLCLGFTKNFETLGLKTVGSFLVPPPSYYPLRESLRW